MGKDVGRVEYAASAPRHFLVAEAANFVDELALPASGIDDMRVRVAKGRQDHAAVGVDNLVVPAGEVGHVAKAGNYAIFITQPGVGDALHARGHVAAAKTVYMARYDAVESRYVYDIHALI